jgi:hypothetical protein
MPFLIHHPNSEGVQLAKQIEQTVSETEELRTQKEERQRFAGHGIN